MGRGLTATRSEQTIIGKYNVSTLVDEDDRVFVVGNGKNTDERSNAFMVHTDGRATVGSAPSEDMDVATKGYVEDRINSIPSPIEVEDAFVMTDLLNDTNVGKVFKYVGPTTGDYEQDAMYLVEVAE